MASPISVHGPPHSHRWARGQVRRVELLTLVTLIGDSDYAFLDHVGVGFLQFLDEFW